jgi:predicted glycoside hydrolase/deacetylase ChbG (UPF0249 family)
VKQLIVTADDVGLHRGMTEGAIRAHRDGIVTACSVVANGSALEHAVERLRDFPDLETGIHLTLVEERPISTDVPSLIGANDLFHENYAAFVPRYFGGRIKLDEVERELRAQIETLLGTGLRLTHANGHQHLHLLPRIFEIVQRLAQEYGIAYVRIVDERGAWSLRGLSIAFLSRLGRAAKKNASARTNDRTVGVTSAGSAINIDQIVNISDGITELVCHPGVGDDELSEAYEWGYAWDAETSALCDPRLRAAIAEHSIRLTTPLHCARNAGEISLVR